MGAISLVKAPDPLPGALFLVMYGITASKTQVNERKRSDLLHARQKKVPLRAEDHGFAAADSFSACLSGSWMGVESEVEKPF